MDWTDVRMETPRLLLRPWQDADAEHLYRFARDPRVGPIAGWSPHAGVEDSRAIIHGVLSKPETYAVVLRQAMTDQSTGEVIPAGTPVGSVGIIFPGHGSYPHIAAGETEVGYWIGVPLWGHGLIPEAVRALLRRCFTALGCHGVWCGYYDGNRKSKRVQEKCGFTPRLRMEIPPHPLNGATAVQFTYQTLEDWEARQAPVTHDMTLWKAPFAAIRAGRKTVELRLYDAKRQAIHPGDTIRFTRADGEGTVTALVRALHVYPDFSDLYRALLPLLGAEALGYAPGEIAHPDDMLLYYSAADIAHHGAVGIELQIPSERR